MVPENEMSESKLRDYLRRVTVDLRKARRDLHELQQRQREPIAIVGIACRYPGGIASAEDLWRLVDASGDGIGPFPEDRGWDLDSLYDPELGRSGTNYVKEGGFLHDAAEFDAGFFGISPREAVAMDPQQRLLLEACWHACEHAGIDPHSLRGSRTGVFAGITTYHYGGPASRSEAPQGYAITGTAPSVASGRVAYALGLEGPAVSIDTACSSSLVALHLACQGLRRGECSLALAGGVAVMANPDMFVDFSRQRGLAPDGRCKSFANAADGTSWSEGGGVLLVERLRDARALGHRVLAVIRGSAVNQDGTSNGLTAPNGLSQQQVIHDALLDAGLSAGDVEAVEGHGTGTRLGDPIEAQALFATYGQARTAERPLRLGSLKSNIGHAQAAAGVAGVIKMVMSLRHERLPKTLHLDEPSREVDWSAGTVSLLSEPLPWPRSNAPRRAGISSFGISGTNAHIILEEAPATPQPSERGEPEGALGGLPLAWSLSAREGGALRAHARQLKAHMDASRQLSAERAGSSLAGRPVFAHRAVMLGNTREGLLDGLHAVADGRQMESVVEGIARDAGAIVFVFPGQGGQWTGMAVALLDHSPVFAEAIGRCAVALAPFVDWRLEDVMRGVPQAPDVERVDVIQPVLFAVMVALAELWSACGVTPDAVVGHSQGEIAAAYVAGGLSLEDAARIVALRSKALGALSGRGGMVSLALGRERLEWLMEPLRGDVSVAAVNGPGALVVSGAPEALEELLGVCEGQGIRARRIPVDYAAHSAQVEEIREELIAGCLPISPSTGSVPFYSTAAQGLLDMSLLDGGYWYRNLRETVHFEPVIRALVKDNFRTFVEISPHPVLTVGVQETVDAESASTAEQGSMSAEHRRSAVGVLGSLRRGDGSPMRFARSLAEAWIHGVEVDWPALAGKDEGEHAELPLYAFQRSRYWLDAPPSGAGEIAALGQVSAEHPLLGAVVALADDRGWLLTGRMSAQTHGWLSDHSVMGVPLLPGTAFLELALHAGVRAGCESVHELTIEAPLVIHERGVQLQISVGARADDGRRPLEIHARASSAEKAGADDGEWTRHAVGSLDCADVEFRSAFEAEARERATRLAGEWPPAGAAPVASEDLYERLADRGLEYGPVFQGLDAVWELEGELLAEVALPDSQRDQAERFGVHPALLDAALHAGGLNEETLQSSTTVPLPFAWREVRVHRAGASALRVSIAHDGDDAISLVASDPEGALVATVGALLTRPVSVESLRRKRDRTHESLLDLRWSPIASAARSAGEHWAVLGGDDPHLAAALGGAGVRVDLQPSLAALLDAQAEAVEGPELAVWEPPPRVGGEQLAEAAHTVANEALDLVRAWLSAHALAGSHLVILTRGAVATRAGEDVPCLAQSAIWGLVRSAQSESPGRLLLVDLDGEQASLSMLPSAVASAIADEEPQLAIREGVVHVPRIGRLGSRALSPPRGVSDWRLEVEQAGTLAGLSLVACPQVAEGLAPAEVRVAVRAAGLNFRDVVTALGMVSKRGEWDLIGNECAGVVLDVGSSVHDLAPGDRVMGLVSGGFGPRAVADRRMIVKVPGGWSFAQAASVPIAFLTAYYGLLDVAGLRAGERLLVHAAAGGVGMAAVQIAKWLGADIFATASPSKWDALLAMGCERARIASSRELGFREQFSDLTEGDGVDVVLNSLAGEFVDASLELVSRGGRFLEMGKTDIRTAEQVQESRPGISYRTFDLIEASPERVQEMLSELLNLFERGALSTLPVHAWDVRQAREAFRFMSQARHVGKIVLTPPAEVHTDGTVLITGGTGQLGGLLARHLASTQGVRNLVLASRRGVGAPGVVELRDELSALGVQVRIAECDVSDRAQLEELIGSIPHDRPLSGVIHAAGVLEDGMLDSLSPEQLDRVFAPKVDAAVHLHELTRHMDLRAFVLFSSAAGVFGAPGQAGYAAANAFLDALASHRRAQGLPATSMAWGWWEQTSEMTGGMSELDVARIKRSGIQALSSAEGLDLYAAAGESGDALTLPVRLDMGALREQARLGSLPALLRDLVQTPARPSSMASGALTRRLFELAEEDRRATVRELVEAHAAAVLGYPAGSAIDPNRAFKELGFDSLLAVELRNRLSRALDRSLSATLVFDYPTIEDLAGHLLEQIAGGSQPKPARRRMAAPTEEPVAIVGMSCRYPGGVHSPEGLWNLVVGGEDAISGFPTDRGWDLESLYSSDPQRAGRSSAHQGGFMSDAAEFDAEFFGIGPREALAMDPQQRLLLETCWEAIERAGIDPLSLRGTEAGVFAGISASGYGGAASPSAGVEGYRLTGNVTSAASGRVAYALGLEGPAMSIDTACSSSLVALHLACRALRHGECSMALAGGVMVMVSPELFVEFSRQGGMAGDGRCKSFSEDADGTGWSEGAGVLLLERLSDALRLGHPVAAVVRGSAINQDGASNGLTAPNGPSQQRVISHALVSAGLEPHEVDAVEAHGTGTTLGDPIEAQALIATYGEGRDREHPLWLGSVKSNIGHAATAAGVAGVIKMAMALDRGVLPGTLHIGKPSTQIDWSAGVVRLLNEATPWPSNGRPRRAGVSSFGISGTNAHVILEQAPSGASVQGVPASDREPVPWVLSARSESSLCDQARELLEHHGRHPDQRIADVGLSLAMRPVFEQRAVVLGSTGEQLLAGVEALAGGEEHPAVSRAVARAGKKLAFMFTGQGAQRVGMGRDLHAAFPVFRDALEEACEQLDGELDRSVLALMTEESPGATTVDGDTQGLGALDRTGLAQPALFAFELAMFRLVESFGLTPDLLVGHSVGELVAAHVAGVLSLADACTLVCARGRLMDALPAGGGMVAVQMSEQEALDSLAEAGERVTLAAVNGPASVVLSGEEEAVFRLADGWARRGRKTKRLRVSHAFHSQRMDGMLEQFGEVARRVSLLEPRIPVISNVTGELAGGELCDPDYWVRHARETVRFADGIGRLAEAGVGHFLELGPDGVLSAMARECLPVGEGIVTPLLRAGRPQVETLLAGLAGAWAHGLQIDWQAMLKARGARRVELPTYAFQRRRYWLQGPSASGLASLGQRSADHPLLGAAVGLAAGGGRLFTGRLSLRSHPWLADHVVMESVLLPGAALVELALHAGRELGCASLQELVLEAPMRIPADGGVQLQVSVGEPDELGSRHVNVHSRPQESLAEEMDPLAEDRWTRHASGVLRSPAMVGADSQTAAGWMSEAWPPKDVERLNVEGLYERLSERGFGYGPAFRGMRAAWRRGTDLFAEVALPGDQRLHAPSFDLHPALLDAALHVAGADLERARADGDGVWLPFSWQGVEFQARGVEELRVCLRSTGEGSMSLTIADGHGSPVGSIDELHSRLVPAQQLGGRASGAARSLFGLEWIKAPRPPLTSDSSAVQWVVLGKGPHTEHAVPVEVRELLSVALNLLQGWPQEQDHSRSPLALLTQRAILTGPNDGPPDLAGAAVWGLARSAQLESPGRFLLVDLDDDQESWEVLPGALEGAVLMEETQLAIRGGNVLVPRLVRVEERPPSVEDGGAFSRGEGTVLVTGGTGGLGAVLARHLVREHGVGHLLLVSRHGARAAGAEELQAELSALGAHVNVVACDVCDRQELETLLSAVSGEHPLRGVVHAAGVLDDGLIGALSGERIDRVLAPKVDGAWHLHELTAGLDLDAFVMLSSAAGTLGSPGQGNYGAANAFLDALAAFRRESGLPAVSLAWGAWAQEEGMTSGMGEAGRARMARAGVRPLSNEEGLELFDLACASGRAVAVPVGLEREALREQARTGSLHPLLRGIVAIPVRQVPGVGSGSLSRLLGEASGPERKRIAVELVRVETARVLGHVSVEAIEPQRTFKELGFDSLAAVELRNRLDALTGLRLGATLVFDYPNPTAIAEYLLERVGGASSRRSSRVSIERAMEEPIAIVGMSCRYPGGVASPEDLWRLVADGVDAVSPFPTDRGWDLERLYDPDPDHFGTTYATEGGFVHDAGDFDCEFFGIGPREALAMDPQQRLLLEASWEALEDAGIDPASLHGSQTGVFAGVMYQDYASTIGTATAESLHGYLGTGSAGSVVSGRVAYSFGLEGPAVSVNTACSSSLVALHWASQALRAGECSLALAGGVTVQWTPGAFLEFSRQRGLARDGRCKSFADCADGTGWSEGVGLLVLERLSEAQRQGHPVLGVLRGSAVNQDGASNGLTAPNGPSQQQVIRQALASADLSPEQVDVVEGHGTGTMLGDPIEVQALLATYGQARSQESPLWLGSIKSNIGHTQAAAGVAGVIKMVMAMRNGVLPATLHVDRPSSQVDWSAGAVSLLTEPIPWPRHGRPWRAAVSSFGISGTNAHVILEQAPARIANTRPPTPLGSGGVEGDFSGDRGADGGGMGSSAADRGGADGGSAAPGSEASQTLGLVPWVVSARGEGALRAQARRLLDHLTGASDLALADVGYALARRPLLERRAVLMGEDRRSLLDALGALARGEHAPGLVCDLPHVPDHAGAALVALLFTGQGAQRVGMGRELCREVALYAQVFDEACAHLSEHLGSSLRDVVFGEERPACERQLAGEGVSAQASLLDNTAFAQAGLFALEVALFRVLESCGVRPDFLIGHSIGELAAAHVAGVFSLEDACKLVGARGRLMGELPEGGAMVAVQASEQEALESLEGAEGRVAVAAVNGPSSVVLSGEQEAVSRLADLWEGRSRKTKRLRVSHAFHSPLMEGMLERFGEIAATVSFSAPQIPIVSNLTGELLATEEICSADYWVRHVRDTVRFGDGIAWLAGRGVRCFIELGPDSVLSAMSQEILGGDGTMQEGEPSGRVTTVALMRRERPEAAMLMGALAEAFVAGVKVDWASMLAQSDAPRVKLPTYAFQRRRYWLAPESNTANMAAVGQSSASHPLLGAALELAGDRGGVFTGRLSLQAHSWLADHAAMGVVLLPGTAYVDLALHVGSELGAEVVSELTLEAPLLIDERSAVLLQVSVGDPDESGRREIDIYSRPDTGADEALSEQAWTRHATGLLAPSHPGSEPPDTELESLRESWPPRDAEAVDLAGVYDRLAEHGMDYGAAFQGLRCAWRRGDELFAEVSLPEDQLVGADAFTIHPALLDAAFHAMIDESVRSSEEARPVSLPFSFGAVRLVASGAGALRVRLSHGVGGTLSLLAIDEAGAAVVWIGSLVAREVSQEQLASARDSHHNALLRSSWATVPVELGASDGDGWALLGEEGGELSQALRQAGISSETYRSVASLAGALTPAAAPPEFVLLDCASPVGEDRLPASMHAGAKRALDALQEWLADERLSACGLVLLTRGAVAAIPGEDVPGLRDAALWGLVQSAQAENPGQFVLVDHDDEQSSWEALAGALACGESRLALRAGTVLVPRLERIARHETPAQSSGVEGGSTVVGGRAFDEHRTVLITGGTGGLGALVARHLVSEHGVRQLLLASRSGPAAPGVPQLEAELAALGAQVVVAACDVSVPEQLERLLGAIEPVHPLGAVVHTAAVVANGLVDSLTQEQLDQVLAAKADAAWHLHELTAHLDLSAFVLFSSIAGLFGGPGQGNYAAANLFLDRLAEHRRTLGLAATSVVWGLWSEAGAGTELGRAEVRRVVGSASIGTLASERGLGLLDLAVAGQDPVVLAAQLDMRALRAEARAGSVVPLLRGLVHITAPRASSGEGSSLARRLSAITPEERQDVLLELVRREAAAVLGLSSPNAVSPKRAFKEMGFDSLAAVELRNRLGAATGVRLPTTLVFDYPSSRVLAEYLLGKLDQDGDSTGPSVDHALQEIERMVSAVSNTHVDRQRMAARLRACLLTLDSGSAEDDLVTATDDEMFEILDTELGAL